MKKWNFLLTALLLATVSSATAFADTYWMKIKAHDKFERSRIANQGIDIETVMDNYVTAYGNFRDVEKIRKLGILDTAFKIDPKKLDFPQGDTNFHSYAEVEKDLTALATGNKDIVTMDSIGKSGEGREIYHLTISTQAGVHKPSTKPGVMFFGTHHAREHVSTEMPLLLAHYLVDQYRKNDPAIVSLVKNREIHIIPLVNPDGSEFDTSNGQYHMWRKNRRNNGNGTFGVDLNRNYGFKWGTGGSSNDPSSDVYMGTTPFSEPETQAVKKFIDNQSNTTILVSFHTFSELILYPWGHSNDSIKDQKDLATFEKMAKTMAAWNGYTPEQASDLYIASGDTTDWAYGEHKIFAFTFELDPTSMWNGGFYPGQDIIPTVFNKNLRPCLYLMDLADNPYRAVSKSHSDIGFSTPLFE